MYRKKMIDPFHCYLCGGASYRERPGKARDNPSLVPLECTACGLVVLSSFGHIGENFYEDSRMHATVPCAPDVISRIGHEDGARRYGDFLHFLVDKSVLDIGCGDGAFLALAKTVAAKVAGVEPDKQWRARHMALALDVVPGLSSLPAGSVFDTISLFHVLEHIPDPLPFLEHVKTFLAPGGRMIVEVPSAQDALLTLYENAAFSEFTYWSPHLFLHTPDTLEKLLRLAGYRQLEARQLQRYPLANHLYWLSKGKPAGQTHWPELDKAALNHAYADALAALGKCDTLIGIFATVP
jgi:SAM-dependent methyltransferase